MKTIHVLSASLLVFFSLLSFSGKSQERMNDSDLTSEWQLLKTQKGINFYVKKDVCEVNVGKAPLTFVYIKIENTTGKEVKFTAELQAQYLEGCLGCANQEEMLKTFVIPANSSISETCGGANLGLSRLVKNPVLVHGWTFKAIVIDNVKFN